MRCLACNVALSDAESVRKDSNGQYVDMCNHCYHPENEHIEGEDDTCPPILEDNDEHQELDLTDSSWFDDYKDN